MPLSHDTILLETVRTRRARLHSALLHGGLPQRRPVDDNVRRVVGSLVAGAVACAGCVGVAVVGGVLADRDAGRGTPTRPAVTAPAEPVATGPAATGGARP